MPVGPLQDIRIIDLTRVWSGPLATRILGDLGAEVIKVEYRADRGPSKVSPSEIRDGVFPNFDPGDQPYNRQGSFSKHNRNKKSLVLDLRHAHGKNIFKRLAAVSDVVIENFSARVMKNLGLGYADLCEVNPAIVMVSMPGFGMSGPYRDYVAYGPVIEPMTGLQAMMGYSESEARSTGIALPDATAGTHAAAAVMLTRCGSDRKRGTVRLSSSQHEAGIGVLGEFFVGYQLDGQTPKRECNADPSYVPHGCYRCAGDDEWVFIAVRGDAEFENFCQRTGHPEWAKDTRFADQESRWQNRESLDKLVAKWTAVRGKKEVMEGLQAVGIPSGAVMKSPDLMADPHLAERHYFTTLDHPSIGKYPFPGPAIRMANEQLESWVAAPLLGQHNREILIDLLGFDEQNVDELERSGVIADRPPD